MNIQNLISQMGSATNPMAMLMNMLNPNQKQMVNQFQSKTNQEQAEQIAKLCNEKGITKEQLQQMISMFSKK